MRKVRVKTARLNPPVKDSVTVPWMTEQEIPAIKLILSRWRKLRKSDGWKSEIAKYEYANPEREAEVQSVLAACACEALTNINNSLKVKKDKNDE